MNGEETDRLKLDQYLLLVLQILQSFQQLNVV